MVSRTKIDQYYFDDATVKFFTFGDAREMAEAMAEVLTAGEKRDRLVAAGLEYADRHSWEKSEPAYFQLADGLTVERFANAADTERVKS